MIHYININAKQSDLYDALIGHSWVRQGVLHSHYGTEYKQVTRVA